MAAPEWDGADINEELIVWNIFEWTKQSQSLPNGLFLTFPIHGSIPSFSLELFFGILMWLSEKERKWEKCEENGKIEF